MMRQRQPFKRFRRDRLWRIPLVMTLPPAGLGLAGFLGSHWLSPGSVIYAIFWGMFLFGMYTVIGAGVGIWLAITRPSRAMALSALAAATIAAMWWYPLVHRALAPG